MARQTFGGGLDSVAWTALADPDNTVKLARNVAGISAWSAQTGGSQYTDLQTMAGAGITTVTADANGIFEFKGPDEIYELWLDGGAGERQHVTARGLPVRKDLLTAKGSIVAASATSIPIDMPVGADGTYLKANSAQATGLSYDTPKIDVQKAGILAGTRRKLNFIDGSNVTLTVADNVTDDRVDVTVAATGGGGGANWEDVGTVILDSFAGADAEARLTAAMSYAGAQTFPPIIFLADGTTEYLFTTTRTNPYDYCRIACPAVVSNPERNSQTKMGVKIRCTASNGLFRAISGATVWGLDLRYFALAGSSAGSFITCDSNGASQFYQAQIHQLSSHGMFSVIGKPAEVARFTAAIFSGYWEINNSYHGAVHMAGSDSTLFSDGAQFDSGPSFATSGGSVGDYHIWFDFLDKSTVGPLYVTCESNWNGVRVTGVSDPRTSTGNNPGFIQGYGWRIEGRNQNQGCNGSVLRVEGGLVMLDQPWLSYGMVSPATQGHSPADAGVVHQSGGILHIVRGSYDRAATVAGSVPWIYSSGGRLFVDRAEFRSKGGTWPSGGYSLPRVDQAGGTVVADGSVTVD
jgi:hypothetical protein